MSKRIFGFAGPIASGKGLATTYLEEKHGAARFRFSTILRDLLDRLHLEHSRTTIPAMSAAVRGAFGEDILARVMAQDIENSDEQLIILDGIRREQDMENLRKDPNFTFVYIDADEKVRYERIAQRGENADDASKTFEEFQREAREIETEITIPPLQKFADIVIDNSGTKEDLEKQLDDLVKNYAGKD